MSYYNLILLCLASFGLTYFLVPLNIKLSNRINLIDQPHARGIHKTAIPVGGGLSFGVVILIFQLLLSTQFREFSNQIIGLTISGFLIMLLGFLDDKRQFTANYKLLFQILIIIFIYSMGFRIDLLTNPFGDDIILGFFSFPVTLIWFLLIINAFNLIDGLDGLLTGISVIAAVVIMAVAIRFQSSLIIALSLLIIGSCLAFLRFNFYPAKIFMGDTGSMFLGLNLAAISVIGSGEFKGITTMTLIIPIIALVIPLTDTFLTVFRRIKRKKHIFKADKEHLHHKMIDLGYSQKNIALISYFVSFLFGLIAFGFSFATKQLLVVILVLVAVIIVISLYSLIKKEFWK